MTRISALFSCVVEQEVTSEKMVSNTCDIATLGPWNLDLPPGPATNELSDSGQMTQLFSDSGSHL